MFSTARELADFALELTGLLPIGSDDAFANSSGELDKYQVQMVRILDLAQREAAITFNKHFLNRKFQIQTNSTDTEWFLPAGFTIEGFKPNTFYDVTASSTTNGPILAITYEKWKEMYPDPSSIARGIPRYIFAPPDDGGLNCKVSLFPYPDGVYTIEGQCRIEAPRLVHGSQPLLFPRRYEHFLIHKSKIMLETNLNEGREGDWFQLSKEIQSELLVDASGISEAVEQQDFGVSLYGNGKRY